MLLLLLQILIVGGGIHGAICNMKTQSVRIGFNKSLTNQIEIFGQSLAKAKLTKISQTFFFDDDDYNNSIDVYINIG